MSQTFEDTQLQQTRQVKALEAKTRGNAFFKEEKLENAIKEFSKAINFDPTNHILYRCSFWQNNRFIIKIRNWFSFRFWSASNRSACYAKIFKFENSLKDANKCVELMPNWAKVLKTFCEQYYINWFFVSLLRGIPEKVLLCSNSSISLKLKQHLQRVWKLIQNTQTWKKV